MLPLSSEGIGGGSKISSGSSSAAYAVLRDSHRMNRIRGAERWYFTERFDSRVDDKRL